MAVSIGLTLDCAGPSALAEFWKLALGYEDEPAPAPFTSRAEWLRSHGVPDDEVDDGTWLHDPAGDGPRLSLLRVPELKVAKNRLHLDLRVSGTGTPEERWARISAKVEVLVAAGGAVLAEFAGHHVTMADPERNEFCVA